MSPVQQDAAFEQYNAEMEQLEAVEQEAEDMEDEIEHSMQLWGLLWAAAEMDREMHLMWWRAYWLYLTQPELMPEPHTTTPWQALYHSQDDQAFITTMGLDVSTFEKLLDNGFKVMWDMTPIPCNNTSRQGLPHLGAWLLDAAGELGLALHFLNSTMREISLQQIFALIPTTVTWYVDFSLDILHQVLQQIYDACIVWPDVEEMEEYAELIGRFHLTLAKDHGGAWEGAFGSIDGLNCPIASSEESELENASYNGWLHAHVCSYVIVFSPRGMFIVCLVDFTSHVMC